MSMNNVNNQQGNNLVFTGNWVIDAIILGKERLKEEYDISNEEDLVLAYLFRYLPKSQDLIQELKNYLKDEISKLKNQRFQSQKPPAKIRKIQECIEFTFKKDVSNKVESDFRDDKKLEEILKKIHNLKKFEFNDVSKIKDAISSNLTNVNITSDLFFDVNTKGLNLFKSISKEKYFFFCDKIKGFYEIIDKRDLKLFKFGTVSINKKHYFIYHPDKQICKYANSTLRKLIESKDKSKEENTLLVHALQKILVKFIKKASLNDFTIYIYNDEQQRVKELQSIFFDPITLTFVKKYKEAITFQVCLGKDEKKVLVKDYLVFALMKFSPIRILMSTIMYDKTKNAEKIVYLLYKYYSLKVINISSDGNILSAQESYDFKEKKEIKNPFTYDLNIKEDVYSLSYQDFRKIASMFTDPKDRDYANECLRSNNRKGFINFTIKKMLNDAKTLDHKLIQNLIRDFYCWMFIAGFISVMR
ncbi:MAG: hypothetical protein QXF76_00330 [Candidatus Anstonellales archaeon]